MLTRVRGGVRCAHGGEILPIGAKPRIPKYRDEYHREERTLPRIPIYWNEYRRERSEHYREERAQT